MQILMEGRSFFYKSHHRAGSVICTRWSVPNLVQSFLPLSDTDFQESSSSLWKIVLVHLWASSVNVNSSLSAFIIHLDLKTLGLGMKRCLSGRVQIALEESLSLVSGTQKVAHNSLQLKLQGHASFDLYWHLDSC